MKAKNQIMFVWSQCAGENLINLVWSQCAGEESGAFCLESIYM